MNVYYENNDELMHYGVLGMKWGKRKASYAQSRADRARAEAINGRKMTDAYNKAMDKKVESRQAKADAKGTKNAQARADRARDEAKAGRKMTDAYNKAMDKKVAKRQAKADKAMAKVKVDAIKEQYRKEYNAGKNLAHRMLIAYTGSDKIYANLRYNEEHR